MPSKRPTDRFNDIIYNIDAIRRYTASHDQRLAHHGSSGLEYLSARERAGGSATLQSCYFAIYLELRYELWLRSRRTAP